MSLTEFRDQLLNACPKLWHYTAPANAKVPYAIWAEDTRLDFIADGKHCETGWQGTLDYFTKTENDSRISTIEDKLNELAIGWTLNSVQFEEDTGVIHFEWVWNIYG